jgi:hypothetical protein
VPDTGAGDPAAGERAIRDDHVAVVGRIDPERGRDAVRQVGDIDPMPRPAEVRVDPGRERQGAARVAPVATPAGVDRRPRDPEAGRL